jgi:pimeloyl-ACP methyl ester carboxylesterase
VLGLLQLTAAPNPDFAVPAPATQPLVHSYLGPSPPAGDAQLWTNLALASYTGDAGRWRLRQCATNLLAHSSLRLRLPDVACPTIFVVGSEDEVATEKAVREDAALFREGAASVEVVPGAFHAPLWTHAAEMRLFLLEFIAKNNGRGKAQAMREAVGMVDI